MNYSYNKNSIFILPKQGKKEKDDIYIINYFQYVNNLLRRNNRYIEELSPSTKKSCIFPQIKPPIIKQPLQIIEQKDNFDNDKNKKRKKKKSVTKNPCKKKKKNNFNLS